MKSQIFWGIAILVIILLLVLLAQAQDNLRGQWVEIKTFSGTVVKGYLLREEEGEYVIQTDYGQILIKSNIVEQIRFLKRPSLPLRARQQEKESLPEVKTRFLMSFGLSPTSVEGVGTAVVVGLNLEFSLPFILEGKRVSGFSLMPEISYAQFPIKTESEPWRSKVNTYLLSGTLFLKKRFKIETEKETAAFVAIGPQISKAWITWGDFRVGLPATYFALGLRGGFEILALKNKGITLALTYYLQEGKDLWDIRVGYLF